MPASNRRPLIVIVGMGETGVLTAMQLDGCDVVGVATKAALVSGQELGLRLVAPKAWKNDYLTELGRFKKLKHVKLLFGRATGVDLDDNNLTVELADGGRHVQRYDYLVIATGITNGFWRDDKVTEIKAIERDIVEQASRLSRAKTIAVIGGGATGTSVAANLATRYQNKAIHFFYSGDLPLPGYEDSVRQELVELLDSLGVRRAGNHRAELPGPDRVASIDSGTVNWRTGQPPFKTDAILWTTGASRPNSGFLPSHLLDGEGFVMTKPTLQVCGCSNVFAIGDVAQTDPNRSSARNWAYRILAGNILKVEAGHAELMESFKAPKKRWGSIIGTQRNGLTIYLPDGGKMHMARWYVKLILYPFKVRRDIYGGVRHRSWSLFNFI
jgi:NADH dehydrogenase FAD-containing subunit